MDYGLPLDTRDIEVFLTLADELHFGRTAERLHLTQARVSQTVQRLERRIGATLFDRTSRRVALTAIGTELRDRLVGPVRAIDDAVTAAMAAARGVADTLCIGFEAPAIAEISADVWQRFRDRYPECDLVVREADFTDLFGMLRTGDIDVLVTLLPVREPDLTVGPVVYTEPMVLAVPAKHPLAQRPFATLDDLGEHPVLRAANPPAPYWCDPPADWKTRSGKEIRRAERVSTIQELFAAVAAGVGIAPLAGHAANYFARPSIAFVEFRDAPPARWGLVWRTVAETARIRALSDVVAGR